MVDSFFFKNTQLHVYYNKGIIIPFKYKKNNLNKSTTLNVTVKWELPF